jgi:hypothetical protein
MDYIAWFYIVSGLLLISFKTSLRFYKKMKAEKEAFVKTNLSSERIESFKIKKKPVFMETES